MAAVPKEKLEEMRGVLRNRRETLMTLDEMLVKATGLRDEEVRGIAVLEYQLALAEEVARL